ncbi:MAG TPA: site-specific integrase [Candidatus Eisenbergiella intestinipullorum]|nr:site-specific integrase [Candidatus Eisenbergiella intestinipullorum]
MSFFYADGRYEKPIRSYSYKEKLTVVFKTCMATDRYGAGCRHILNRIPAFRYVRKNVAYLTGDEIRAIRNSIDSDKFSLLERAVMMLLLYTGMRSCDVAASRIYTWICGSRMSAL